MAIYLVYGLLYTVCIAVNYCYETDSLRKTWSKSKGAEKHPAAMVEEGSKAVIII